MYVYFYAFYHIHTSHTCYDFQFTDFFGISECAIEYVSESMFSVPFWSLFLLFVCFALFCVLVYALLYYILLLSLRSLLCNERQKGGGFKRKGRWGETRRYRGRETVMIYIYEKINFLSFFFFIVLP